MTSSVTTTESPRFVFAWMFGRKYDLLFYFLPVFVGCACFMLARFSPFSSSAFLVLIFLDAFGAGPFHWGPTWFAYFDKKNRTYWNGRKTGIV